jgi:hypothetical protein
MPWQSPYVSMDNNPILFNDPLGDKVKIKGKNARRSIRRAKREDGAFKEQFKQWRQEKGHTYVFDQTKGNNNGLYAAVRDVQQNGKHTLKSTWVNFDLIDGNLTGTRNKLGKVNPLGPPDINIPSPDLGINTQRRNGVPALVIPPPPPRPVNVNVNAPFTPGNATFRNRATGQAQLQTAATAFLNNPNASQLTITIGTNVVNINQPAPNDPTVGALLNRRGQQVMNILQGMGVPASAISPIQLAPGTSIGTTIQVR